MSIQYILGNMIYNPRAYLHIQIISRMVSEEAPKYTKQRSLLRYLGFSVLISFIRPSYNFLHIKKHKKRENKMVLSSNGA